MNEIVNIKIYLDLMHKCYHDIMEDIIKIDIKNINEYDFKDKCNFIWIDHYEKFQKNVEAVFDDNVFEEYQQDSPFNAEA